MAGLMVTAMGVSVPLVSGSAAEAPSASSTVSIPPSCVVGKALHQAGLDEQATTAYLGALVQNPNDPCAREGLDEISSSARPSTTTTTIPPCQAAEQLKAAGATSAAKDVLNKALAEGKAPACPEGTDLVALLADLNNQPIPAQVSDSWSAFVGMLPAMATALMVLLVIIWWPVKHLARRWRKPQLVIGPFVDSGGSVKAADALTALTATSFHRHRLESRTDRIDLVDEHQELATALDGLEKIDPKLAPIQGFWAFLSKVVSPIRITLAGQLHGPSAAGVGITLRLTDSGSVVDADTLRFGPLAAPKDATDDTFAELALPAAAWTRHITARLVRSDLSSLSTSAASYAWLCAGQQAAAHGDSARAVALFERALDADPEHLRARIAHALAVDDQITDFDVAAELLFAALADAEELLDA